APGRQMLGRVRLVPAADIYVSFSRDIQTTGGHHERGVGSRVGEHGGQARGGEVVVLEEKLDPGAARELYTAAPVSGESQVSRIRGHAHTSVACNEALGHCNSLVGGGIVDDEHLEV